MEKVKLGIEGMSCGHCVAAVKRALEGVEGVRVENVAVGEATVEYDASKASADAIRNAVEDEGYTVVSTGR